MLDYLRSGFFTILCQQLITKVISKPLRHSEIKINLINKQLDYKNQNEMKIILTQEEFFQSRKSIDFFENMEDFNKSEISGVPRKDFEIRGDENDELIEN